MGKVNTPSEARAERRGVFSHKEQENMKKRFRSRTRTPTRTKSFRLLNLNLELASPPGRGLSMGRKPNVDVCALDCSADILYDSRAISGNPDSRPKGIDRRIGGNRPLRRDRTGRRDADFLGRAFHLAVVIDRLAEEEPLPAPAAALPAVAVPGDQQLMFVANDFVIFDCSFRCRRPLTHTAAIHERKDRGNEQKQANPQQRRPSPPSLLSPSSLHKPHAFLLRRLYQMPRQISTANRRAIFSNHGLYGLHGMSV